MYTSLELVLFEVCWCGVLNLVSATPEIKTGLEQTSQDFIFTDAITTVTTEITFNDVVTSDVKFDMYTSLDFPDFLMKTPARVKMGPNLHVTGSLWPEYDAKDSFSYPGMSFSACFDLGNVTMKVPARGRHVPGNNSIVIQYEAMVPEERLDISEPKHVHSYGVIFQYGDAEKNVIVYEREAKFAERKSMPLLYQALTKTFPEAGLPVREMVMGKDPASGQPKSGPSAKEMVIEDPGQLKRKPQKRLK